MKVSLYHLFLVFSILIISIIYFHATDTFNQDLGRHIKIGEIIWETKSVPKTNLFSYTHPHEPVFNSHWGSQVVFYLIHRLSGTPGLIVFAALINTIAFGILFWFAARKSILVASILFIPTALMLIDRAWIRPEIFGHLFFAILLLSIYSGKLRKYVIWSMPLMALLWINLHITAVFGVFVMAVVLLRDTIERISNFEFQISNLKSQIIGNLILEIGTYLKFNITIFLLIFLALFINPYGFDGVKSAFTILNKYGYTIVENQSWAFLRDFGFTFLTHIAIGIAMVLLSFFFIRRRPSIAEVILITATTLLMLRFVRNEIFFAYTAFFFAFFNILERGNSVRPSLSKTDGKTIIISVVLLTLVGFYIFHWNNSRFLPFGTGNREYYKAAVDYFLAKNIEGPIFNDFDIGGYLIYRLYPKEKVFVDNRPEAYPVAFFDSVYKPMQHDPIVFKQKAEEYGIKSIIWARTDITPWSNTFLSWIVSDPDWKQVYVDEATVIFVRK